MAGPLYLVESISDPDQDEFIVVLVYRDGNPIKLGTFHSEALADAFANGVRKGIERGIAHGTSETLRRQRSARLK